MDCRLHSTLYIATTGAQRKLKNLHPQLKNRSQYSAEYLMGETGGDITPG